MTELEYGCARSRDSIRVDLRSGGEVYFECCEAVSGNRTSVLLTDRTELTELRDALTEWLERNA